MKAFKAYDIRGEYNKDFTKQDAYKIGYFLPRLLPTDKILVGRDARLSSDEIFDALSRGICDAGADVYDAGLCSTPMIYYGTAHFNFAASVQITASHNPPEHNGMKISSAKAMPVGYDSGLKYIEQWMAAEEVVASPFRGKIVKYNIAESYYGFLEKFKSDISSLNVCIDLSNGMSGLFAHRLFGDTPHYINDTIDGRFPGHEPNPLEQENLVQLKSAVKKHRADIGIIFDGDADRVMFVDEKGEFISPDLMIALLGHYFSDKGIKGTAIQDIRTSKAVGEYLQKLGFDMYTWRVGRAFAAPKLKEIDGVFGGELAGHYYFRDFYFSDSGILACLLVLKVFLKMHAAGTTLSEAISNISKYKSSGEINFKIAKKQQAMDAVKKHFFNQSSPLAFYDFDGYRLDYENFWFNIRPSNTEPYLRFIAEAKSEAELVDVVKQVKEICLQYS
ncbi:MAG TPA: phosphomannomutase/phosphoglucomutase [Prolixibacteraceae bacterium]|nr:phosphomannomutase/phosphoglucomutase [Prolixibacteraceae bacterium]